MEHKMTIDFRTMYNIVCATIRYYKKYKEEKPEQFDIQDEEELAAAIKLKYFLLRTSALKFTIKDWE